nr:hypothetical protein Itr_chr14CG14630 [Ipomoea trifida]
MASQDLARPISIVFKNLNHHAEVTKFNVSFHSIWCCSPMDLISAISLSSITGCNPESGSLINPVFTLSTIGHTPDNPVHWISSMGKYEDDG